MAEKTKKLHEPLVHITKRESMVWWKAWLVRVASIVVAMIVCALLIVCLTGYNPLEVYREMFKGSFGSTRKIWITMQNVSMLLCIALAVTPAFKMKYWNLGAEGQVLIGGLASAACMIYIGDSLPTPLMMLVMLVTSILCGLIWAIVPAVCKAKWGTNESLFTLMMNYVAIQLVSYFITLWENPKGSASVGVINPNNQGGWIPTLFGQKYLVNIIIVALLTIIMFIYLRYSKHGYEISVVGESTNTARYVGINVKKTIIRTVALSGAICGIAGMLLVSGTDHTISTNTAGGQGFTAIVVSWLAKFNPFIMMLTSFLIVFLQRGAGEIATTFRLNESMADILTGLILFFIIGCEFFVNYRLNFRSSKKEAE